MTFSTLENVSETFFVSKNVLETFFTPGNVFETFQTHFLRPFRATSQHNVNVFETFFEPGEDNILRRGHGLRHRKHIFGDPMKDKASIASGHLKEGRREGRLPNNALAPGRQVLLRSWEEDPLVMPFSR